ncbi:hypothetical protein HanHA300_Chr03g0104811 [Helianthus annuus]|nr:hypothetical protein HanHA300_Chr03g0104811 [Helianthus annuus]KAJ0609129.1 hypothetical protein HanHA89_Chr03g0116531 [Helianthus annuus]KAJ0769194.1 hypothetical protein HanLR1_Chr03g0110051 [Helianthus annuus]
MENQPREAKKKTKGRGLQPSRGGSSGASAQPQPPFGYTSQPPFFFQQPSHPSFYNTQPPTFNPISAIFKICYQWILLLNPPPSTHMVFVPHKHGCKSPA